MEKQPVVASFKKYKRCFSIIAVFSLIITAYAWLGKFFWEHFGNYFYFLKSLKPVFSLLVVLFIGAVILGRLSSRSSNYDQ